MSRVPLARVTCVFAPVTSLQDAARVAVGLEAVGIESLVRCEGLVQACLHAAPLVRDACGLSCFHLADLGDMVSRVWKCLCVASCSNTTDQLEIATTSATSCSCGGALTCLHGKAVKANVQGLSDLRVVLHIPKRPPTRDEWIKLSQLPLVYLCGGFGQPLHLWRRASCYLLLHRISRGF